VQTKQTHKDKEGKKKEKEDISQKTTESTTNVHSKQNKKSKPICAQAEMKSFR
jgi:hypothetical protein